MANTAFPLKKGPSGPTGPQGAGPTGPGGGGTGPTGPGGGGTGPTGAGGGGVTWLSKSAAWNAVAGTGIFADTSGGVWTLTLPATPSVGDMVSFNDATNSFAVNNLTIGRNGSNINGDAEDLVCDINGMSISLVYANAAEGWVFFPQVDESAGVSLPRGYIDGLILSNNTGDASHDIDISVGCARDTTNTADCYLLTGITKQIDAAWAVGTGAGGMDTGAVGNTTWYHVWIIKRSDTGVVDVLFSTSATAPTMPASYDIKRRIKGAGNSAGGSGGAGGFNLIGYLEAAYLPTTVLVTIGAGGTAGAGQAAGAATAGGLGGNTTFGAYGLAYGGGGGRISGLHGYGAGCGGLNNPTGVLAGGFSGQTTIQRSVAQGDLKGTEFGGAHGSNSGLGGGYSGAPSLFGGVGGGAGGYANVGAASAGAAGGARNRWASGGGRWRCY